MTSTEEKIEDNIKEVIALIDRKIKYFNSQIPLSEEHLTELNSRTAQLLKQREHFENAIKEIEKDGE